MDVKIPCLYSCFACGLENIEVLVPARESEGIDAWMNGLIVYLSADHERRSPNCHPEELKNVKIPITGASKIGGAAEN